MHKVDKIESHLKIRLILKKIEMILQTIDYDSLKIFKDYILII